MPARNGLAGMPRISEATRLRIASHLSVAFNQMAAYARASRRSLSRSIRTDAKDWAPLRALGRKLLIPAAASCTLAVAGCASRSVWPESKTVSTDIAAPAHQRSGPAIHRSDRALLTPLPAPDCAFQGPDHDTVDADLLARLKLDYERHCYQHAEMVVRNRLRLLQASVQLID